MSQDKARQALQQEALAITHRRWLLATAATSAAAGDIDDALRMLVQAVRSVTDAEERVVRLHAECVNMLEHAGKILALDAALRPVVLHVEGPIGERGTTPSGPT